MRKFFVMFLSVLMMLTLTACGAEEKNSAAEETVPESNKVLVAYFSCTGTTKALAESAAEILHADLYEIKPEVPYTSEDLNWRDETTRATVEQRDETSRPALADKNANISQYKTVVIAFPIWWGVAPRIIDTFVESYDFAGKNVVPICTSGGSELGSSEDYLKILAPSANWLEGKSFFKNNSKEELKNFFDGLNL